MNVQAPYDELFTRLQEDDFWGTVTFELKAGSVKQIKIQSAYRTIHEALQGITIDQLPLEGRPSAGEHHGPHRLQENGHAL